MKSFALGLVLFVSSCATGFPAPPALTDANSGIVIAISLSPPLSPLGAFDRAPEVVYFLREGAEQPVLEDIIVSRYVRDGRFYALGIEPGVYVPIACAYNVRASMESLNQRTEQLGFALPGKTSYTTFFSKEMAAAARANASSGELFVMGTYKVNMSLNFKDADEFQKSNRNLLSPDVEDFSVSSYLSGNYLYAGSPRDTVLLPAQKAELLKQIGLDLAGSEWTRLQTRGTGL